MHESEVLSGKIRTLSRSTYTPYEIGSIDLPNFLLASCFFDPDYSLYRLPVERVSVQWKSGKVDGRTGKETHRPRVHPSPCVRTMNGWQAHNTDEGRNSVNVKLSSYISAHVGQRLLLKNVMMFICSISDPRIPHSSSTFSLQTPCRHFDDIIYGGVRAVHCGPLHLGYLFGYCKGL